MVKCNYIKPEISVVFYFILADLNGPTAIAEQKYVYMLPYYLEGVIMGGYWKLQEPINIKKAPHKLCFDRNRNFSNKLSDLKQIANAKGRELIDIYIHQHPEYTE